MLRCKDCGAEFRAGIQMDEATFKSNTVSGNVEQCPRGHQATYDQDDYFFGDAPS